METFQLYFLQASMGIVLFYLLYLLLLKNETYYTTNRFFLIVGLMLALVLPLFPITYESPIALMQNAEFFTLTGNSPLAEPGNAGNIQEQDGYGIHFTQLILWFYIAGMAFFLMRLLWQTVRISWKIRHSAFEPIDGIKVINQKSTMPYSFFNVVFIDIQEYSERELSNIIAHEKVHILERHWVDLLIIELMTVLFWVNPVVWLYERSIKQNHEYLADQGVLLAGYSPGQYQALLINQLLGVKVLGFAHNLNFSLNKKRLEMMKKEKSSRYRKVKILFILPVITGLLFAFAKPKVVLVNNNLESNTDLNQDQFETAKEEKIIQENFISQQEDNIVSIKGTVKSENNVPLKYAIVMQENSSNGSVVDENGEFQIDVPQGAILEISYLGYKTITSTVTHQKNTAHSYSFAMEKGIINIKLPKIAGVEIKKQLPPPPPPKHVVYDKDVRIQGIKRWPFYSDGGMPIFALDIQKEVQRILQQTENRGEVLVGFTIDLKGKVQNPHIIRSSNSTFLDASAVGIITKLDNWSIGYQGCDKASVNFSVPVKFEK